MEDRNNQKKGVFTYFILIITFGIFLFSGYKLCGIFSEYRTGSEEYEAIQEYAVFEEDSIEIKEKKNEERVIFINFEGLQEINPEIVGWIRFDEPSKINYPIVQSEDNDKYLKTTFEGNRNAAGTIFMDYQNTNDFSDQNTFIYGHNMKNGSMFGQLRKYKDSSFCEEYPYFYVYTPDGAESIYQVFAVCIVKDGTDSYIKRYAGDTEFQDYIDYIRSISLYSRDVSVGVDSKIVSLSTCTNVTEDERLLVHGVKLED